MVKNKNILVTGANGQLGSSIKSISKNYKYNFFFTERNKLDITNFIDVNNFLNKNKINIIINCAAYTDVIEAETNIELANRVNNLAVDNLANHCSQYNIQLIHISTDFVFDGLAKKPYLEIDYTNPISVYGLTKLNGEKNIFNYDLNNSIIIRTSWLFSLNHNNFVTKILKKINKCDSISVVNNEFGSPTNSDDLAESIMKIIPKIKNKKTEIYNYSNTGFCSRHQFAKKIIELVKGKCILKEAYTKNIEVKRPPFSALNSKKIIDKFDIAIDPWDISLERLLKKLLNNPNDSKK